MITFLFGGRAQRCRKDCDDDGYLLTTLHDFLFYSPTTPPTSSVKLHSFLFFSSFLGILKGSTGLFIEMVSFPFRKKTKINLIK